MANGNNDVVEFESGAPKAENKPENEQPAAPKKADVLIKSTNNIALKQEELSEQTKQIASRLDEAMEKFAKSSQDSSYIVQQSGEIFAQLQSENASLKQELMYLAKQNENIYAGLEEKINQLSAQLKGRGEASGAPVETFDHSDIADRLNVLIEYNRRYERAFEELYEKLEALSERTKKAESEASQPDEGQLAEKLNYISEQLRKSEGARTMLADKFEILSMRVEQFGLETAKGAATNHTMVTPVAFPMQGGASAEIDYDKLAQKVADLISAREVISPDYIASKVAEQVIIPEVQSANVQATVDADEIAGKVAELLEGKVSGEAAPAAANVSIDEEGLAERIAQKIGGIAAGEGAAASAAPIDEDELAERIAKKVGGVNAGTANVNLNEDELADSIAIKVGSLKAEDFEILVDDAGCTSISKEITENLDYNTISNIIADKLREVLDLNAANAPDYEEMAERISEKITVAGINEAAIADKAAAALSNYLPEIDTDEIADKVTGAVIDVVSAMPQPTVDTDTICNTISEKLIQSQEDHDYDVVIDEEGISKISELVTEEIEKQTSERFDKVESGITDIYNLLQNNEEPEEDTEVSEEVEESEVHEETDYSSLAEVVAAEIEKGTASRFDKVEDDIAKLADLVSSITVEDSDEYVEEDGGEYSEEYNDGEYVEEDYTSISEIVAAEIEKGVASRLTGIEENVAKITEYLTAEEEAEEEEDGEEAADEYSEEQTEETDKEDYAAISEAIEVRLSGIEENVAKIAEYLASEEQTEEASEGEENEGEELAEEDYNALSEAIETRLSGIEENVAKLTEYLTSEENEQNDDYDGTEQYVEEPDYAAISEAVAAEIERGVAFRLTGIEDNLTEVKEGVAKLNAYFAEEDENPEDMEYEEIDEYAAISEIVAAEIQRGLASRLDGVEEKLSSLTEGKTETNPDERIDKVQDDVARIKEMLSNGVVVASEAAASAPALQEDEEEEEELVTVSGVVEPEEQPVHETKSAGQPADDFGDEDEEFGEEEEEDNDNDDFSLDVLDMDAFSDDELMPGEFDYADGVDFASMMKYKRSFIARIIQSDDNCKQYYGEVKHALLSYKKVNSNVAWGAERFNKGRETIARLKMRGKTLCLYLALDPNNYKTTVYHHVDVSANKSVAGTPMMVKIKSNLGVRKAIRLIDEMLAMREGEKREILERDYAAMYPYETIEDLIEEGLVKDVRKK